MSLRPADVPVLQAALRTRVVEAERLADILRMPAAEVRVALERLAADGLVVRTADDLPALPPPPRPIVAAALAELRGQLAALESVCAAVETLPARLREGAGVPGAGPEVPMELVHGTGAIGEVWARLSGRPDPIDAFCCVPDAAALARLADEEAAVPGSRIRLLVDRAGLAASAEAETAAETLRATGAELRSLDGASGWFAGEGRELSAFPTAWGAPWPLSIRLLRDPLAAQSLRSYFDELWRRAAPLDERPADWEPVLRLLEDGLDDGAIAGMLGISERTVRRRVDEAMLDLGATNRFTLGRAWARLRSR